MTHVTLIGPLATTEMRQISGPGQETRLSGRLTGGELAGIEPDQWPVLSEGQGALTGWTVPEQAIRHYAAALNLTPMDWQGQRVLGAVPGQGGTTEWAQTPQAQTLAAEIARDIMRRPQGHARLTRLSPIADARLRAATEARPDDLLPPPERNRVEIEKWSEPYADFFAIEDWRLRHRLHKGGWSDWLDRAVFVSADAALLLPWDPHRDRVMLIDQFRVGPFARGDKQCWMLEPIAGRVDALETPEEAARREAQEEAGLEIGRIFALPQFYSSPGGTSEMMFGFVGIADLPDSAARDGGLEDEGEDIRSHLLDRAELMDMVEAGRIPCGPLVTLALWLDRMAPRWQAEIAAGVAAPDHRA